MLHTFENGFCTTCGESLDHLADVTLRDRSLIGPKLPVDDNQGTFQLSINIYV